MSMWLCLLAATIGSKTLAAQSLSVPKPSPAASLISIRRNKETVKQRRSMRVQIFLEDPDRQSSLSYDDTDGASKGVVSTLTAIVNSLSPRSQEKISEGQETVSTDTRRTSSPASFITSRSQYASPPASPEELMERLRLDYVERNYLWTGDLDLLCFEESCKFTDPTISFIGTDTFRKNTQNLVPLVDTFVDECRSDLLSVILEEEYVETRWNMVGSLTRSRFLFWKPKIDVIGRTKFWFRPILTTEESLCDNDPSTEYASKSASPYYQVYFYDEVWEIPAYQALLQLITPPGTFPI